MTQLKAYYYLTKPGIVYSNALTAIAGFFLASKGNFEMWLFFSMLLGIGLVVASACVFNNYLDRNIDAKMGRTKKRALVTKRIPETHAIIFATILGFLGFFFLLFFTNFLTTGIAFVGFFFYVVVYGIAKRNTVHGTVIGSIPGAVPPVVGYCAVTNQMDLGALLLFLILVFWQMPHFYAIAIFRSQDYASASIPVLPLKKGLKHTKIQILVYAVIFIFTLISLSFFHYTGYTYLGISLLLGILWIWGALQGFRVKEEIAWARKMFFFSLVIITLFSLLLIGNSFLP